MLEPEAPIPVRLPRDQLEELNRLAAIHDVTVGQIIRKAVTQFLAGSDPKKTLPPPGDDLRTRITQEIKKSSSWIELSANLKGLNIELYPKGGGLALRMIGASEDLCKASELGFGYSALIKKFKCGMPGHPHHWLPARILGADPSDDGDDLVEPL